MTNVVIRSLTVALVTLGTLNAGYAQDAVSVSTIPDLRIYEVTEPQRAWWKQRRPAEPLGFRLNLAAGRASVDGVGLSIGDAALTVGVKSRRFSLAGTSSVTPEATADFKGIRGDHRVLALTRNGDSSDERATQLALEAWARHSGGRPYRLERPRFAFVPVQAGGAAVSARLRLMHHSHFGLSIPIKYSIERATWTDTVRNRLTSQALTTGIGFAPTRNGDVRGTVDAIRVRTEHTSFEPNHALTRTLGSEQAGASGDQFRKASIGIGATDFVFREGGFTLVSTTAHIGWSWLELERLGTVTRDNAFDLQVGSSIRWGRPGNRSRVGLGLAREPSVTADGRRLLVDSRLDVSTSVEVNSLEVSARGGISQLRAIKPTTEPEKIAVLRYGGHLEAFYKLTGTLQVGGYGSTSFEPRGTLDPWNRARNWTREAGLMLRLKLRTPEAKSR